MTPKHQLTVILYSCHSDDVAPRKRCSSPFTWNCSLKLNSENWLTKTSLKRYNR